MPNCPMFYIFHISFVFNLIKQSIDVTIIFFEMFALSFCRLAIVFLAFDVVFAIFCLALACVVGVALCCCLPCIIGILYAVAGQVMY